MLSEAKHLLTNFEKQDPSLRSRMTAMTVLWRDDAFWGVLGRDDGVWPPGVMTALFRSGISNTTHFNYYFDFTYTTPNTTVINNDLNLPSFFLLMAAE